MPNRIRFHAHLMAWIVIALWGQSIQIASAQVPPDQNRKELVEAWARPSSFFAKKPWTSSKSPTTRETR